MDDSEVHMAGRRFVFTLLGKDHREEEVLRSLSGDMAEEENDIEVLLNRAKDQERRYDWFGAADDYARALKLISNQESARADDILERKSYALYKAALQSENVNDFRVRTDKASECYSKAKEAYIKVKGP